MAGRSVDVAGHYRLVNHFSHTWRIPSQIETVGDSPIPYMIGGAFGRLIESPFLG
jgi:hypothetical protein